MVPADDGASPAPLDRAVLGVGGGQYPGDVSARFEIRWYCNDNFTVHCQEERQESVEGSVGPLRKCEEKAPPFRAGMNPTVDDTIHRR
jgi:hypothetical protein